MINYSLLAKCETGSKCVLQHLYDTEDLSVISGESFFCLEEPSAQFDTLVTTLNLSSLISYFEVWSADSRHVFRIWSAITSRVSAITELLKPFHVVPLSLTMTIHAVLQHLPCCRLRSKKATEINDFFLDVEIPAIPITATTIPANVKINSIANVNSNANSNSNVNSNVNANTNVNANPNADVNSNVNTNVKTISSSNCDAKSTSSDEGLVRSNRTPASLTFPVPGTLCYTLLVC